MVLHLVGAKPLFKPMLIYQKLHLSHNKIQIFIIQDIYDKYSDASEVIVWSVIVHISIQWGTS